MCVCVGGGGGGGGGGQVIMAPALPVEISNKSFKRLTPYDFTKP